MSRSIQFLLTVVVLFHGASGYTRADDSKRGIKANRGTWPSTPEVEYEKGSAAFDRKD